MFGWVMLVLVILEHIYHVIIIILIIMSLCDYHYLDYHVIIIKGDVGARHTGTYLFIQKTKRRKDKKTKIHKNKKTKLRGFYCDVSTLLMFLCLSLSLAISHKI